MKKESRIEATMFDKTVKTDIILNARGELAVPNQSALVG